MMPLIEGAKPYKVKTSCGHIVIRHMRECIAGVPFTENTVLNAPNGIPCDDCQTERYKALTSRIIDHYVEEIYEKFFAGLSAWEQEALLERLNLHYQKICKL